MQTNATGGAFSCLVPGYAEQSARLRKLPELGGMGMSEMIIESPDEVVAFLKAQHNLIEDMFDQVLHASDPQAREKPFVQLRQLLAVHETAEEMIVHPRVRRDVDGMDSIVDARLEEEHEAKELLSSIEKLDVTSKEFVEQLTKLRDAVLDHAQHEETYEFSKLQQELEADELKRLTKAVQAAEAIAPTRPHAGVESAKLNFAVGPFASMLDRARDLIEHGFG
jgi:hemerythrin superfamily protein